MKRQTKLSEQEQEQQAAQQQTQQQTAREFATVEEMIRHDALHTPVPPSIAHRLRESIGSMPPAQARSWWRRLLGS